MTAALKQEITFENGRAMQTSIRDYPLLRFSETPSIEVYLVNNNERPTGIGEMGNPPIAPAIANALYTLTGKRIRRLPIRL